MQTKNITGITQVALWGYVQYGPAAMINDRLNRGHRCRQSDGTSTGLIRCKTIPRKPVASGSISPYCTGKPCRVDPSCCGGCLRVQRPGKSEVPSWINGPLFSSFNATWRTPGLHVLQQGEYAHSTWMLKNPRRPQTTVVGLGQTKARCNSCELRVATPLLTDVSWIKKQHSLLRDGRRQESLFFPLSASEARTLDFPAAQLAVRFAANTLQYDIRKPIG